MANPLQIAWQNYADADQGGTVTANEEAAGLPATNLQLPDVRLLWRATSGTADIVVDLGSIRTVQTFALIRTNMSGADTVSVRASETDPTALTSLSHNSGVMIPAIDTTYKRWIYITSGTPPTARYVRIALSQASTCEAGRLFISTRWNPSSNFQYGWAQTWRDASRTTESLGQSTFVDTREAQRGFRFNLTGLDDTDVTIMTEINRRNGTKRDILVCRDRDSSNLGFNTIFGLMNRPIDYSQPRPLTYDAEFEVWDRDRL